jgi:hypothetical protein
MLVYQQKKWLVGLIALSAFSTFVLMIWVDTMDPNLVCCDHLFYRAQAVAWTGIDAPYALEVPPRSGLNEVYEFYLYERENGLTNQPPYSYRILVPLIAGILSLIFRFEIDLSFFIVNALSLFGFALASGLSVWTLTRSRSASIAAVFASIGLPAVGLMYAYDYMLVDVTSLTVVATVLFLIARNQILAALLIAAFIGPLVKETLVALALCVVVYSVLTGSSRLVYWILGLVPLVLQGLLRLVIEVPSPPSIGQLFAPGDPYLFLMSAAASFAIVSFLVLGMFMPMNRQLAVSFLPLFVFLAVVTSSTTSDGARIWLTFWPIVLVLGICGLWNWSAETLWWPTWLVILFLSLGLGTLTETNSTIVIARTATLLISFAIFALEYLALGGILALNPRFRLRK